MRPKQKNEKKENGFSQAKHTTLQGGIQLFRRAVARLVKVLKTTVVIILSNDAV